jgi:hypothetical protein
LHRLEKSERRALCAFARRDRACKAGALHLCTT